MQTGNGERSWSGIYSDNTWHHVRIDFESSLGGYLGLEQYKLNFWFNGIQLLVNEPLITVSYTHLTLPTTPYV